MYKVNKEQGHIVQQKKIYPFLVVTLPYFIVYPKLNKILLTILQEADYSSVGKESACNTGDPVQFLGQET